ncbi:hypothetical protein TNCV_3356991 [Trichonephila clavipes]|nr:hypothetical protein TNCV_3356991 [Trichonephila clavipes]
MMLGVTGKRNAKRSSIPYLDCVCGLMWVGLPGSECPDWLVELGKEAWLQKLRFSCIRFRRSSKDSLDVDQIRAIFFESLIVVKEWLAKFSPFLKSNYCTKRWRHSILPRSQTLAASELEIYYDK